MVSGWNLWLWLQCIGVVSGCYCKEVYRFLHNITYPTPLALALFCNSIPTSLLIFNPRRACAERVTVVVVCVCMSVTHTLFWQYARLKV